MRLHSLYSALFLASALAPWPAFAFEPPEGQLDASSSLFAVLAAINSAGYDTDVASTSNHPLRAEVRQWVAARNPASLTELRQFFAHHHPSQGDDLGQYVSYALSVAGPPDFKPRYGKAQMPPDTVALQELTPILARFYAEADLATAWQRSQPAFEQLIAAYHGPVTEAVYQANAYLRNPTSGMRGRRFQIYIDLLGAPNQVHTRSFGDDYFVVVTPSPNLRSRDIRHAYLDHLIDPLAIRYSEHLEKKKGLGELSQASPILSDDYKMDFTRLAGMSLVRAVEARLDGAGATAAVNQAMAEGFILTAFFYEALPAYEKQERALRLYLPEMLDAIDVRKEDQRIAQVEFVSKASSRRVRPPAPQPKPLSPAERQLAGAEQLYEKRDLPAANAAYRQLMAQQDSRLIQSKASFGLARVAALEKHPELSQQWFERCLELDPEPFERAWSHVYLARLARAAEDFDAAVKHYQAALAVDGASEGARKAAQQELAAVATRATSAQQSQKD